MLRGIALIFISVIVMVCMQDIGPSFSIDYERNTFLKDGKPFRYISGSVHYFRVPHHYWGDRLQKMKYAGLNAVQVYVAWNVHEPEPGVYDFVGQKDLLGFLKIAQQMELLVILRPGPYICAEWEFGGFPYWLIRDNATVLLRSSDPQYITPVKRWLDVLLPKIKPLLYENGGPIITVQVENEFGSYFTCDRDYTTFLRDYFRQHLGSKVTLFTTDGAGAGFLKCGVIPDVYPTVDFGPGDAKSAFDAQRLYAPKGPLVNSEYYVGWLDHWGEKHSTSAWQTDVKTLDDMLAMGANVNMYMFEGGTNFGYMNGANYPSYKPQPTSYDYDAPLSEAGDMTYKYTAIREIIQKYIGNCSSTLEAPPTNVTKKAYGSVQMTAAGTLFDLLPHIMKGRPLLSTYPITMEQMNQSTGYILYRTELPSDFTDRTLNATGVMDWAYVFVGGALAGVVSRTGNRSVKISGKVNQHLDIIVENQGRINYGSHLMNNVKGLTQNVTLEGHGLVTGWAIYSLDLSGAASVGQILRKPVHGAHGFVPTVYRGTFNVEMVADTFLNTKGWSKGVAFVNSFNLGRYWPKAGPQVTLYVPAPVLKSGKNSLMMVEFEGNPSEQSCTVNLTDKPVLDGPVAREAAGSQSEHGLRSWRDHASLFVHLLLRLFRLILF